MPLPEGTTTIVLTGTYATIAGDPVSQRERRPPQVGFTPSAVITDGNGKIIFTQHPVIALLNTEGEFSVTLACTDNTGWSPSGWCWNVDEVIPGLGRTYSILLPSTLGETADISDLSPVSVVSPVSSYVLTSQIGEPSGVAALDSTGHVPDGEIPDLSGTYLSLAGGTMTGFPILPGNPTADLQAVPKQYVDGVVAGGGVTLAGDLGNTTSDPQVISTHLAAALPVNQGGTGAGSAAGALTSLGAAGTGTVNTFAGDQRFASGRPCFDVTSSAFAGGADSSGASDSTPAFTAAILAATGSAAPASNTRVAAGPVFIPAGTYQIKSDLLIQSVEGFQFLGAGADCTTLVATGTDFTTAVINIDGSLDGTYGGFQIRGAGGEGAGASGIPSAVSLTWTTGAQRSTSANTLRNIRIRNLNFIAGITQGAPASTTRQVDGTTLQDIVIAGGQTAGSWSNSGNWQQGFVFGNGTSGNQYDYALYNCSAGDCYYGWYCASSGFELHGAQPAGNYCDFYLSSPGAQVSVQGVQSQNAQMLVTGAGGSGTVTVSFRDIDFKGWYTSSPPGGKWVSIGGGAAAWEFSSVLCWTGGSGGYAPVVAITGSGAPAVATFTNLQQSASLTAGFSLSSLVAGSSVTCVNYVQLGTSAPTVAAVFPLWAYAGGAWAQVATGLPLAVASGGSGSGTAAGSPAYAAKASATETIIYVSQSGSDSNDGLSWGSAKATIAGAITALGTTGSGATVANNPGLIQLGTGTWTDTATHTITSVKGFTIQGLGQDKTQVMGPDGAAWVLAVNCQRAKLKDLTYQGSPSGTGWGFESQAYWQFGSDIWYGGNNIGPTMNGAENVTFGRGGVAPSPACAYGIRFTISSAQSDGNNDEGLFINTYFLNCVQAISVEHSNSLQHIFLNPRFGACGGCIAFQGGSANLINPVVGGAAATYGSGYIVDFQPAIGNFNTAGSGTPNYHHDIDIIGMQNESNLAWVRSQTLSTNGTLRCKFTGGNLQGNASGGYPTSTAPYWVNWQAAQATSYLTFTNMTMGTASETTSELYGTATGAYLGLFNCSLTIDNYNWAGIVEQDHCLFQLGGVPSQAIGTLKVDGLASGTSSLRPTAVAFGGGWYYETDNLSLWYSNGVLWTLIVEGTLPNATNTQWFTTTGSNTWTMPPNAVAVEVLLCGPGGGGGGGARGPSGDVICGGGGGAAGAMTHRSFLASQLTSTVSVGIGAGGTGGAAASGDSMPGGAGGAGGSTSFGSFCFALAGNAGSGGTFGTSAGTGTGGVATTATYAPSGSGGTCTNGGAGGGSNNAAGPSSGGAGGGISSGPTAHNGGASGYSVAGTSANTGAAGIVDTSLPGGGTPPAVEGTPGCGGAGGAASVNATSYSFTATSASPCVFTAAGSAYLNGATLTLTGGSLPAGFATATTYYVVSASGATFELSASSGGAPISSTSTGSGTVNGTGAQNGANAAAGGGGGGGGASLNGNASGQGGTGGGGFALIITYF